jgi:tRNA(Met) C34 N-acetyltransferase TmcA
MVSLYVSSHYKNTPNDLLLMADAPAHHLFVLLGPVDETQVGRGGEAGIYMRALWCV